LNSSVLVVAGTRPEGIKLAPVVHSLGRHPMLQPFVLDTGQHPDLLGSTFATFGITADSEFGLLEDHVLGARVGELVRRVGRTIERERPELVIVQGDTVSALAGALAGFYAEVPVAHVEAGLRTSSIAAPFPEEGNRRLITPISALHFCATPRNRMQLLRENVPDSTIFVTGNTVIDALHYTLANTVGWDDMSYKVVEDWNGPMVLVTAHRRESWGEPLDRVAIAVEQILQRVPSAFVVVPLHPNPIVRKSFERLASHPNVLLTGPASYPDTIRLLEHATLTITDSGGLQEEAPAVATPALVIRTETERIEAIEAGTARLVGTDIDLIVKEAEHVLTGTGGVPMIENRHLYGDGKSADRIVAEVARLIHERRA
jgi:UDP-N-acetylglucosamine 2-epimerase (non-hydrolysing)